MVTHPGSGLGCVFIGERPLSLAASKPCQLSTELDPKPSVETSLPGPPGECRQVKRLHCGDFNIFVWVNVLALLSNSYGGLEMRGNQLEPHRVVGDQTVKELGQSANRLTVRPWLSRADFPWLMAAGALKIMPAIVRILGKRCPVPEPIKLQCGELLGKIIVQLRRVGH